MSRRQAPDELSLADALRALAEDEARAAPGPDLQARVMESWDRVRARPRRRRPLTIAAVAAAVVLGVTAAAQWGLWLEPAPTPASPPSALMANEPAAVPPVVAPSRARPARTAVTEQPARSPLKATPVTFVVVGEPLAAGEAVQVVRMRVAADRLAAFGLRPLPRAESVDVELLVGEDGVARGLRLNTEME
jgi:hypothetical protein